MDPSTVAPPPGFQLQQTPPLPPGFQLQGGQDTPPLPPGFQPYQEPNAQQRVDAASKFHNMTSDVQSDLMAGKAPNVPGMMYDPQGMSPEAQEAESLSRSNPLGLAEQLPAGLQAGLGVAAKIAGNVAPNEGMSRRESGEQAQQAMMKATDFLSPQTETGALLAGTAGAGFGKGQEALQDPAFYKKHGIDPQGPTAKSLAFLSEVLPDVMAVYGIRATVGETGKYAAKARPVAEEIAKATPGEPQPAVPQGESTPLEFWKQRAMQIQQNLRGAPNGETIYVGPDKTAMFEGQLGEQQMNQGQRIGSQFGGRAAKPFEEQNFNPETAGNNLSLAPQEPMDFFVRPEAKKAMVNDTFQGGGGIPFQLRQEVLDTPELRHAIESVTAMHQDLTAKIDAAADKYKQYEGAGIFEGRDGPGFEEKYRQEIDAAQSKRDALEEQFADEMRRYGIVRKQDAFGRKIYDTIPDGMWNALRVKIEQQNARQMAGGIANQTLRDGTPIRTVEAGTKKPTLQSVAEGQYEDKAIPLIATGRDLPIGDKVFRWMDIPRTLEHIANTSNNPVVAAWADQLRKWNPQRMGITVSAAIDKLGNVVLNRDLRKNVKGEFLLGSKAINIQEGGLTERIFTHEVTHGVLSHAFLATIKGAAKALETGKWTVDRGSPLAPHVQALLNIWEDLRDKAMKMHPEDFANAHTGNWLYGLTSPLEMISEAGMNDKFMRWTALQVTREAGKTTTLMGKMREAIRGLVGGKIDHNTLDQVFFHSSEIANAYAHDPHMWDDLYHEMNKGYTPKEGLASTKVNDIPGLEEAKWIPEPIPFEKAKPQILKEKDSGSQLTNEDSMVGRSLKEARNNIGKNMLPGSVLTGQMTGSTLIKNVSRIMTSATSKSKLFVEKYVKPVEQSLVGMSEELRGNVHDVLMKELFADKDRFPNGKRFTPEQLKSFGLSPKELAVYTHLRTALDAALKRNNEIREAKGLKPITGLDAYFAARWSGMYRADIVDAQGKKIWGLAEKTSYGRDKAIKYILDKNPELRLANKKTVNIDSRQYGLEAGYKEMLDFLDKDDPRTKALQSVWEEMNSHTTDNVAGQEKHFMVKSGVRGYAGDRPWSKTNATDFFDEQVKYLEGAFKWNEMQGALEEAKKYTSDPQIRDSQPNNVAYAEDYIKNKAGFGTNKKIAAIENDIAQLFGLSPSHLLNAVTIGKDVFYITELAFKIPFIEISLLQSGFSMAQHAMLTAQGYAAKSPKYIFDGILHGTQHALLDGKEFLVSHNPALEKYLKVVAPMEGFWDAAKEYAHANDILTQNPLMENADVRSGPRRQMIENIGNFTTSATEKVARGWTFYGMVGHLADSGKFDLKDPASLKEMFQKAEDATNVTMADYRNSERSMAFNKGGLAGKTAAALKTYPMNMLGQLLLYSREAQKGNYKPLAYFTAMQFAVAGAGGMFFVDDIDAVWHWMKRMFPAEIFNKVKDWGIKKWLGETFSGQHGKIDDIMYNGPVSALTGMNISTQGSMGRAIPGFSSLMDGNLLETAENVFPSVHENFNMVKAVGEAAAGSVLKGTPPYVPKPTPNETMQSIYEATPTGAKGLLRETAAPFKGKTNPDLMMNPHNLAEGEYVRNQHEHDIGKYGYVSPKEQRAVEISHQFREIRAQMDEHRKEVVTDLKEYALRGDTPQVQRLAILYFDLGGDVTKMEKEIGEAAFEKITSMKDRAAVGMMHSQNPTEIQIHRDFLKAITGQK